MKHIYISIFLSFITISAYSQTIEKMELDLRSMRSNEKWGGKMKTARKLLKKDPLNPIAVNYIAEWHYRKGTKDDIGIFFDDLQNKNPFSATPYILRVGLGSYEDLTIANMISYLEKGHKIEPDNEQVIFMLGLKYYELFYNEYNDTHNKDSLDYYAENATVYFEKLSSTDCQPFQTWGILMQLYNYQQYYSKLKEMQKKDFCGSFYFPALTFSTIYKKEGYGSIPLPSGWETDYSINMIDATESSSYSINWYSEHLRAMNEPILYIPVTGDIIRFTCLRTFHSPIAVRIENRDGEIHLFWKKASGHGGYDPGNLVLDENKQLNENDWIKIINKLDTFDFWSMPTVDKSESGLDGSQWILEANIGGKYHVVDRWCGSKIYDLCMAIFEYTEMKEEIY